MVWYKIFSNSKDMVIGSIPKSFQVRTNNNIVLFTTENATKNMNNYISKFGQESWSTNLRSELMLESYLLALDETAKYLSTQPSGKYENLIYKGWIFSIDTASGYVLDTIKE